MKFATTGSCIYDSDCINCTVASGEPKRELGHGLVGPRASGLLKSSTSCLPRYRSQSNSIIDKPPLASGILQLPVFHLSFQQHR